jgi:glycerate kinase
MHVLAAPDKLRGTLTAREAAAALAAGAARNGWTATELPLADGGEGTLEAFGGPNRSTVVRGPLGAPVEAAWRLDSGLAVIEMARASGLALVERNDPVAATSFGTGQLIAAALAAGATQIVVGVGGSATTDGGLGAIEALGWTRFAVPVEVACDVTTRFEGAAAVFGPQKGATPEQVRALTARLHDTAERYRNKLNVDARALEGSGAAGGLAGGLAALGATLTPGFELVARHAGLDTELGRADLVLTAEGSIDATSFVGKVVGGVLARAGARGIRAVAIGGAVEVRRTGVELVSLTELFGRERALRDTAGCLTDAAEKVTRKGEISASSSAMLRESSPGNPA